LQSSKTTAGVRQVVLEPELVQLLREHKIAVAWTKPDDFIFAGRIREKPREGTASALDPLSGGREGK
jgi:hypothetical protein